MIDEKLIPVEPEETEEDWPLLPEEVEALEAKQAAPDETTALISSMEGEAWRRAAPSQLDPDVFNGDDNDPRWPFVPAQFQDRERYRLLRSHAIFDRQTRKIVARIPGATRDGFRDKDAVRRALERRAELQILGSQAWRRGMVKGMGSRTVLGAVESLSEHITKLALDVDPRRAVLAARLSLEMGEFLPGSMARYVPPASPDQADPAVLITQAGLDKMLELLDKIDQVRRAGGDPDQV